jgi:hypothetical protein
MHKKTIIKYNKLNKMEKVIEREKLRPRKFSGQTK